MASTSDKENSSAFAGFFIGSPFAPLPTNNRGATRLAVGSGAKGEPMKNPAKALEFSLSLVEAIHHTGQADMIQAAEQSLAALLNGAVALRGMRREPSPRCAANVMEFTRWLEKIPTRKAAARLGEQVNDELTIILSSVAEAMRELEFSHPVRDRLAGAGEVVGRDDLFLDNGEEY